MTDDVILGSPSAMSEEITTIQDLLKFWDCEELIDRFEDEEIDLDTLGSLTIDDLKDIIPKLGPRKQFMCKLEHWQQSGSPSTIVKIGPDNFLVPKLDNGIAHTVPEVTDKSGMTLKTVVESEQNSSGQCSSTSEEPENIVNESLIETKLPQMKKSKCDPQVSNPIPRYLRGVRGQKLVAKYNAGKFEDRDRQELSELIIYEEMGCDTTKVISPERFIELSLYTTEIFVDDNPYLYYIPRRVIDGKAIAPKGKFYNTYRNCSRELAALDLRTSMRRPSEHEVIVEPAGTVAEDIVWLSMRREPWRTVCEKWKNTTDWRVSQLRGQHRRSKKKKIEKKELDTIATYLSKYSALTLANGYMLLELDFMHLYPGCDRQLATNWDTFARTVCRISGMDCGTDLSQLTIFHAFASLFDPTTLRGKGGKKRSTKVEIIEGFLLHLKAIDELDPIIGQMREKANELNSTNQPFPVVIGLDPSSITDAYVVIDQVKYRVENTLRAVDVAFKSYHALHARYPIQSEGPWLLLQQAVYGIRTEWDSDIPRVIDLISKFSH